jgi:hypothetical protein
MNRGGETFAGGKTDITDSKPRVCRVFRYPCFAARQRRSLSVGSPTAAQTSLSIATPLSASLRAVTWIDTGSEAMTLLGETDASG